MTNFSHNTFTGGSVTIEDGLKAKEEYAPARKVSITLNYSTPEDGDGVALLDYVIAVAQGRQASLLHSKAPAATEAPAGVKQGVAAAEADKKARTLRAAAPKEPTDKDKQAAAQGLPTTSTQHKGTTAPLVEDDGLGEETPVPAPATPKDDLDDLLGDAAPAPVTDQELGKAAQEKNGAMKGVAGWAPEKIRELVGKFVQADGKPKPGAKLQEIPAAQRPDFLAQLKALK